MRRLMREISELKKSPPEGIRIITSEENILDVTGIIEGPGKATCLHICLLILSVNSPVARGHAIYRRVLPSTVQIHRRIPRRSAEMSVNSFWALLSFSDASCRLVCYQDLPPKRIFCW